MIYLRMTNELASERIGIGDVVQIKLNDRSGEGLYCVFNECGLMLERREPDKLTSEVIGRVSRVLQIF